jgi:hypothetical protein
VSRSDLLQWLNEVLEINYAKLDEASNGAAFCQVIDAIFPGKGISLFQYPLFKLLSIKSRFIA